MAKARGERTIEGEKRARETRKERQKGRLWQVDRMTGRR